MVVWLHRSHIPVGRMEVFYLFVRRLPAFAAPGWVGVSNMWIGYQVILSQKCGKFSRSRTLVPKISVVDPDSYVFGPSGSASRSVNHMYGSDSGFFHHQAKIGRKTLFLLFCDFFMTFYECFASASGSEGSICFWASQIASWSVRPR